jgi:hypothetical protein
MTAIVSSSAPAGLHIEADHVALNTARRYEAGVAAVVGP